MKKTLLFCLVFLVFACKKQEAEPFGQSEETIKEAVSEGMPASNKTPAQLGENIFNGKGNCATCHKVDTKTIGPSVQEIAKTYKDKNSDIVKFLKGGSEAIVDPSQFEVMKANFAITKAMTDDELEGLEAYIYSNLK
ncbi:c-type cytochrome [Flavobacterium sp.]|uniref:c-type cytochrome n=1 Tax=Flavobacterium sp. TaxID=239 RepID=UPI003C60905D